MVGAGSDPGRGIERTLIGAFVGLIVLAVVATLFITGEYRRGLIRSTFAASPRRGRVLAAKALVVGGVTFVAALVAAGIALPLGEHVLRGNGNSIYPTSTATEVRAIVGTAALLAVAAVLALALGAILRRSAMTVTAVIALIVLPYILAVASVLSGRPGGVAAAGDPGRRLRRPADARPVSPGRRGIHTQRRLLPAQSAGRDSAVLCGYTACALALATYLLRRRDV